LNFQKIRHNEYIKSAVVIVVIVGIVLGLFFGLGLALGTSVPVRVVESGSMCVPYGAACQGLISLDHPFTHTLHTGDLIVVQGVNAEDLNANYPNSDIIVYLNPSNPSATPIVHRIVAVSNINGTLYFQTKGDGNGDKWPAIPSPSQYDSATLWHTGSGVGIPQSMVVGKVVMRIPYVGWITLFLKQNPWGLPAIIAVILLLIVLEFVIPLIRRNNKNTQAQTGSEATVDVNGSG
jgi:signal peptidase I